MLPCDSVKPRELFLARPKKCKKSISALFYPTSKCEISPTIAHEILIMSLFPDSEDDKPTVLLEAEVKMAEIRKQFWYYVAVELVGEDPYKFLRAYTGGE